MIVDHLASPAVAGFSVSKIWGQGPVTIRRVMYHDQLRIADQRGSYAAVVPR
jgi:hypothetical protein